MRLTILTSQSLSVRIRVSSSSCSNIQTVWDNDIFSESLTFIWWWCRKVIVAECVTVHRPTRCTALSRFMCKVKLCVFMSGLWQRRKLSLCWYAWTTSTAVPGDWLVVMNGVPALVRLVQNESRDRRCMGLWATTDGVGTASTQKWRGLWVLRDTQETRWGRHPSIARGWGNPYGREANVQCDPSWTTIRVWILIARIKSNRS